MGPQIWNNIPQDMCTFLVKTIQLHRHNMWRLTYLITGTCMGGGRLGSIVDTMASVYIYNVYIVCSTIVVSRSSCRLASTSMISKYIKLIFLKTSNYAIQSQILFSTYLKVHVYHITELFIYAFKSNLLWKFNMYAVQKIVINLFINNNALLTLNRW